MSDCVQPYRGQPTRLPCPWDSPGKNTGVGCHFLLQCMKVKSLSRVRLFMTPWTAAYQAPPSMGFSRQEYWSGLPLPSPANVWNECNWGVTNYHTTNPVLKQMAWRDLWEYSTKGAAESSRWLHTVCPPGPTRSSAKGTQNLRVCKHRASEPAPS